MTSLSAKLSLSLIILLGSQPVLSAQREAESQGGQGVNISQRAAARRKMAEKKRAAKGELEESDDRQMTPEELLESRKRRGSRGQCRFVATMRPPKLLPGESGTLMVTAILQGKSVMQAPSPVEMTPRVSPGFATLGALSARPAPMGTIHQGYLGRPVYENTAIFEVPVAVSPSVKLGETVPIALDLEFDIYDGDSARVVGRFIERVQTTFTVAQYVDPPVAPISAVTEREDVDASRQPDAQERAPRSATPPSVASGDENILTGANSAPTPAPEPTPDSSGHEAQDEPRMPRADAGSVGYNALYLGVGILLLVVLLLVARKR